jgi:hypothetical protein
VVRGAAQRRPFTDWAAESLRLSAFIRPGYPFKADEWWRLATGADAEIVESNTKQARRTESGPFGDDFLILQVTPGRADWILTDRPDLEGLPTESNVLDRMDRFSGIGNQWLPSCPPLMRLAFGAVLHLPGTSREDSYHTLSNYLDFDLDPKNSSDFRYQINRWRSSQVIEGMRVNRFCTWGSVHVIRAAINIGPEVGVVATASDPTHHFCRLELDLNTAPECFQLLETDKLADVFAELVKMAKEIAENGDIP